jgi:Tfp pilus assembly protein FimT
MHPRSRHFLSGGFTLTDLLVIIVIIATLSLVGKRRMIDLADKTKGGANSAFWRPNP